MVGNVSSMSNSAAMMRGSGMQGPPPPPKDNDVFQVGDSNGDGLISADELTAITEGVAEVTGNSIDVESALSSYDANSDGGLSGEELLEMLTQQGFSMPEQMPPPPPPQSAEQAAAAYGKNSGDDQISKLLELLQSGDSEEEYTSVNVVS